ncbi:MAG: DUF1223 domain-containing protein [Caulobacter sp.]|nr:DUF1223 domain-containing protein [Caulobacter sp.]
MRNVILALFVLMLAPATAPAATRQPVVVELYTAQGCSSCVKANALVADLAERPDVLPLIFSVDYWDYLGWTDSFAQPAFADRQHAFVKRLALREVYTPQVVIDGRVQTSGVRPEQVLALVEEAAAARRYPPQMMFMGARRVAVGSGPAPRGGADVWLVRYDARPQEITPRKGDNRGQTLIQRNVVRQIVRLGVWRGKPTNYRLPAAEADSEGLSTAVLVQTPRGGRILAVIARPTPAPSAATPAASGPRQRPAPGR